MKTLKVFVDDHRKTPVGWEEVRTVFHAQRLLATGRVDIISLDNDKLHAKKLPSGLYIPEGEACDEEYMAIAYAIAMCLPEFKPNKVILHTTNSIAARQMEQLLTTPLGPYNPYNPSDVIIKKYSEKDADRFYGLL